ncbi:MAG: 2-oxo acid dehydrogenase subunit E2 [Erysipelotrichaceae bacterium]|nr:2-oxo acid dehydrogenase subunit E2 [Erysipelotrichaceae bacterium]
MAFGDRKDGKLLKNIDSMHFICPIIYPKRCDNEAFISELIDITKINEYLEKKNKGTPDEYKYNMFQVIVTAMLKIMYLRPKMNYFIANSNLYERNEVSASFIIKKQFKDDGSEGLAFLHSKADWTIDTVHEEIKKQVTSQRKGKKDASTESMDIFNKLPRFLSKFLVHITMLLDRFGYVPKSLIATDPYYSSVVLTNLGSIKLHAGYHHLTNWGTNSVFLAIGEIKKRPFLVEDDKIEIKESIDLGLTIDERIADGYYYSKTVALLRKLFENPELLEEELCKEVEY